MPHAAAGFVQRLAQRHGDTLKLREETFHFIRRQRRQQAILGGMVGFRHDGSLQQAALQRPDVLGTQSEGAPIGLTRSAGVIGKRYVRYRTESSQGSALWAGQLLPFRQPLPFL
jgi:hypothetical protein